MKLTGLFFLALILGGEAIDTANVVRASKAAQEVFGQARVAAEERGVQHYRQDCHDECSTKGACSFCGSGLCCRMMRKDGGRCPGGFEGGVLQHVCIDPHEDFVPEIITEKVNTFAADYRSLCVRAERIDALECWREARKVVGAVRKLNTAQKAVEDEAMLAKMNAARAEAVQVLLPADMQHRLCAGVSLCNGLALLNAIFAKLSSFNTVKPRALVGHVEEIAGPGPETKVVQTTLGAPLEKLPDDPDAVLDELDEDGSELSQGVGALLQSSSFLEEAQVSDKAATVEGVLLLLAIVVGSVLMIVLASIMPEPTGTGYGYRTGPTMPNYTGLGGKPVKRGFPKGTFVRYGDQQVGYVQELVNGQYMIKTLHGAIVAAPLASVSRWSRPTPSLVEVLALPADAVNETESPRRSLVRRAPP